MKLDELRELIRESLIVERMAMEREDWQEHLLNYLKGALREFYKARLGEKNKLAVKQDIDHWMLEVTNLLDSFIEVFNRPLKGGQKKQAAFSDVKSDMMKIDQKRRKKATSIIEKYYGDRITGKFIQIDDNDTLAFWNLVQTTIDEEGE